MVVVLAGALGGCIAFGSIDKRSQAVNRGVANAQNMALLTNLVRASRSEPLYFTATSAIHGAGSQDFNVSLPSFTVGPAAPQPYTFGATNLLDSNTSTSFDVNVLNSKDFYAGVMSPLGPDDVNLLFNQGYSREMVLYLVVDRLEVTDLTGLPPGADDSHAPTAVYFNDPANPSFPIFRTFVDQAMLHGLTTEEVPPAEPAAAAPTPFTGGTLNVVVSQEKKEEAPKARLCYDWALATEAAKQDFTPESPRCGAIVTPAPSPSRGGSSVLPVKIGGKRYEIIVYTRSILGIFKYLGGMIANGDATAVQLHHYPQLTAEVTVDGQLFDVRRGFSGPCFAEIEDRGARYCVPEQGAANTKVIFSLLDALIALKTAPGDLPAASTVRITP